MDPRSTPEGRGTSLSPISTVDGDVDQSRVPLLSPLPSSDGLGGSHVTIDMSDGDGKPVKTKVKRKDTGTSTFTNFLQRFSRSSAEIKATDDHHRLERGDQPLLEEEETVFIERPDTLQIPDEEQWFESRTSFDQLLGSKGWTTALTPRTMAVIDETRVKPLTPHPDSDKMESNEEMQKALEVLLEDFRSDNMGGLSVAQMSQMDATRRAHERITDTHRKLADEAWGDTIGEKEETTMREAFNRMYDMLEHVHSAINVPTANNGIRMSDMQPPSPTGPSLPSVDAASAPAESGSNLASVDPGPSNDVEVCAPISVAPSSGPSPSPSSSQQASPSSVGVGKYESKELKQLKERIEFLGFKGSFAEQVELLRGSGETILAKNLSLLEEFLVNLDPTTSTAGIVVALCVMMEGAVSKKLDKDMMKATEILKHFVESRVLVKDHIMLVIDYYTTLFRKVAKFLIIKEEFTNGIPFVSAGIDLIVETSEQAVTTLHGCLFILCLKAHAIGPGLNYLYPYIKTILPEHNPASGVPTNADSRALLTYLYYGALLEARATHWKRSASLLKAACFLPGYAVSEIQIEALKKLHIISYIAYGSVSMPIRSPNLAKAFKQNGSVYAHMAAELEGGTQTDWDEENHSYGRKDNEPLSTSQIAERAKIVHKYMNTNRKAFEKDQNVELLMILMREFKLKAVLKVAELFKVASLARITEMAKLDNVEETKEVLTALIDNGRLLVSDDGNDFVRLELPPITQSLPDINERQQRLVSITEDVKRLDLQAKKTTWYMQRTNKAGGHPNDDEGLSMSNVPENFAAPNAPTSVPS